MALRTDQRKHKTDMTQSLATHMRAVIFAGHDTSFSHTQAERHKFGLTLVHVLCTGMRINEACGQHAMLLWTISVSMGGHTCGRGADIDVCVACLMVCCKMHNTSPWFGLSKFAQACALLLESREGTTAALEYELQHDACKMRVHFLTSILKLFEYAALAHEIRQVSAQHLRRAEHFLFFTSLNGTWYRYLIDLYEYTMSRTQGMSKDERICLIVQICDVG